MHFAVPLVKTYVVQRPCIPRSNCNNLHMSPSFAAAPRSLVSLLQVDGLCAMVEGVQDLVARAEQISAKEFVSVSFMTSAVV